MLCSLSSGLFARTVYVARHGQVGGKNNIDAAVNELKLTPLGREQAQLLARHLREKLRFSGTILVSPYYRTIETSMPIARMLGKKVILEPGIQELNRGSNNDCMSYAQTEERFPGMTEKGRTYSDKWRISDETDDARQARTEKALKRILAENPGDLLIVTHDAIIENIKKIMNGNLPKEKQISGTPWNCSLWIFELDEKDQVKSASFTTEFIPDDKVTNNFKTGKLNVRQEKTTQKQ